MLFISTDLFLILSKFCRSSSLCCRISAEFCTTCQFLSCFLLLPAGVLEAESCVFPAIFPAIFRQPEIGETFPYLALHSLPPFAAGLLHIPLLSQSVIQLWWLGFPLCLAAMAKLKKSKQVAPAKPTPAAAPASQIRPAPLSTAPVSGKGTTVAGQPVTTKAPATSQPSVGTVSAGQLNTAPGSMAAATKHTTQVGPSNFHQFISDMETSPPTTKHVHSVHTPTNQTGTTGLNKEVVPNAAGLSNTSFAGLFNSNRKLSSENKLTKFVFEEGPLTLQSNDLVDVHAKLEHFLVGYIAGKFPGLKAICALAQSWGASFHQHDSGWLSTLLLKNMPDCFKFKDDDISVTPVWAIFPSLPLECWHPNALGKIGSRLGTPIAMESLTMSMERVSYARILVEVDASKKLVDQVEFVLPNGVTRKQPVVYEFTPKFCSECHRFGHSKDSCKGSLPPTTAAATNATTTVQPVVPKKVQDSDWTLVKRRNRFPKYAQWQKEQQQQQPSVAGRNDQDRQGPTQQLPTPAADSKMQAQPGPSGQEHITAGQGPIEQA
ncbi:hypothetical protein Salat_2157400 [Sesamum alatum]|uniref:DUF4283 domain-containing protein n=1 Tax=Sesamum alatum TaxID=300844 RepID=A0AAE1Y1L9_9LAMI|nr:hypothetical protein Salat_2157400 [Sesamum alatum]